MQTKGVQEGGQTFHHDQNGQRKQCPQHEDDRQEDGTVVIVQRQTHRQHHVPQYFGQF